MKVTRTQIFHWYLKYNSHLEKIGHEYVMIVIYEAVGKRASVLKRNTDARIPPRLSLAVQEIQYVVALPCLLWLGKEFNPSRSAHLVVF